MRLVLLTWTIRPGNFTETDNSIDPKIRNNWYTAWILYYITQSDFSHIVFCENSNMTLSQLDILYDLADQYGKKIEYLTFQWDFDAVQTYDYWYGEAEIIDYAFENSAYIKNASSRYKITGRYVYPTINQTLKDLENTPHYFLNWLHHSGLLSVQTDFFKTNNKIYRKYIYKKSQSFYRSYIGSKKINLEQLWYSLLRNMIYTRPQKRTRYIQYALIHRERVNFITYLRKKMWILEFWYIPRIVDMLFYSRSMVAQFIIKSQRWK